MQTQFLLSQYQAYKESRNKDLNLVFDVLVENVVIVVDPINDTPDEIDAVEICEIASGVEGGVAT